MIFFVSSKIRIVILLAQQTKTEKSNIEVCLGSLCVINEGDRNYDIVITLKFLI